MTIYKYLPALNHAHYLKDDYSGISATFWKDNSLLKYDSILFSYFFFQGKQNKNIREQLEMKKDFRMFGDSGGFSIITQNAKIYPLDVINWMNANCDIGVILDIPPYRLNKSAQFSGNASEFFDESLNKTIENSKIMFERWNRKFDLFGVIQGETYDQKMKWYKGVSSVGEFRGYALSPKPSSDMFQIASYMLLAKSLGIKKIHLLQVSSKKGMATIYYVNKKLNNYFDLITFDSSTPFRIAFSLRHIWKKPFGKVDDKKYNADFKGDIDCDCVVCKFLNQHKEIFKLPIFPAYLSLHNLNIKLQEVEILENMELNNLRKMISSKLASFIDECSSKPEKQRELECSYGMNMCSSKQKTLFD